LLRGLLYVVTLIGITVPYSPAIAVEEAPDLTWYKIWSYEGHDVAYGIAISGGSIYTAVASGQYISGVASFLLKYDLDGNLIWSKNWTKNQINEPHGIAASESSIYMVGLTGSVDDYDAFLLKYDSDGNLVWSKIWGVGQSDWAQSVTVSGGSIYVTGSTGSEENYDAFLSKYDPDGNLIWSKTYGGSKATRTMAYGIATSGGSIYVVGSTGSEEDYDAFLLKYDSDGRLIWSKTYGGIESEAAYSIAISGGNIYTAGKKGFFQGYGTLLLKYDSNGDLIWGQTYERSRYGGAYGISISEGGIYTAGVTWGIGAGYYEATLYKIPLEASSTITEASSMQGGWTFTPLVISLVAVLAGGLGVVYMIRRRGRPSSS